MQGWFKFHRMLFDKPIWISSNPIQKTILITLLGMANHKENEWEFKGEKFIVREGQFITSLESIVAKCGSGVTIQNVRTALNRFEKYEFLTNQSTNKNRLITIVNWGFYQGSEDELTSKLTSNQQATNKQLTTNKNVKNVKNEKKEKPSRPKFETCDMEMAELLFSKILENNPEAKKPNLDNWAKEFRLMRERDERTIEAIRYLIDWTQKHHFWHKNVLSPSKLREQYDRLTLEVKAERNKAQPKRQAELDTTPTDIIT